MTERSSGYQYQGYQETSREQRSISVDNARSFRVDRATFASVTSPIPSAFHFHLTTPPTPHNRGF